MWELQENTSVPSTFQECIYPRCCPLQGQDMASPALAEPRGQSPAPSPLPAGRPSDLAKINPLHSLRKKKKNCLQGTKPEILIS